jgi:hypothetical protein
MSRTFIFVFREKNQTKIYKNNKNFRENENWNEKIRENKNFYEHLCKNFTFWCNHILTRIFHNFWQKCSRKRKFSRNEISRKLPHFRMIFAFRENEKTVFVSTLAIFTTLSTDLRDRDVYQIQFNLKYCRALKKAPLTRNNFHMDFPILSICIINIYFHMA